MGKEIIMSDERTIMEETAKLMNLIESIEEKIRISELELTEVEMSALEKAKLRLSEIEKANQEVIQRNINDSLDKNEGLFSESQRKEIKEE